MSESGKVEIVDIKFGNKLYKNVSVDRLNPTDESSHSHPRKKKKMKVKEAKQKLAMFLEKNVPTNPGKWSYYKSQAKKKFDVYPSAYANMYASAVCSGKITPGGKKKNKKKKR